MITLLLVFVRRPFTEDYARINPGNCGTRRLLFVLLHVTSLWGFIFLANTLVNFAKLYYPEIRHGASRSGIRLVILSIAFTTAYTQHARRKRLASHKKPFVVILTQTMVFNPAIRVDLTLLGFIGGLPNLLNDLRRLK